MTGSDHQTVPAGTGLRFQTDIAVAHFGSVPPETWQIPSGWQDAVTNAGSCWVFKMRTSRGAQFSEEAVDILSDWSDLHLDGMGHPLLPPKPWLTTHFWGGLPNFD